jgi:tetratricopeptide (TPR) repeat protein
MAVRVSSFVCVALLSTTFLYCGGARGESSASDQTGITVDQTPAYTGPEGTKLLRMIEPGTALQVTGAQGQRLRIAALWDAQALEGWIDAKNLLALDPALPYHRALGYQGSRDEQRALEAYTAAIEADGGNSRAYYNRALLYRQRADTSGTIADCSEAIKIDPKFAEAYLTRGNAYANQDDLESAVKDYGKAIAIRPGYGLAYYNRGLARHLWACQLAARDRKTQKAMEEEQGAFEDLQKARTLGLPASIARRLEKSGQPADLVLAAEIGYVRLFARGALGVYGVGGQMKSLIPLNPQLIFPVLPGTRFASAGAQQNMVACGRGTLCAAKDSLGIFEFKGDANNAGSIQAACLDASRPTPEDSDRFRGTSYASEDVQKLLSYVEYPQAASEEAQETEGTSEVEVLERAAIQVLERMLAQEAKGRGFPNDPKAYLFFHQQVRQAAVWAVTDDMAAKDITARLGSITDIHARVAAKILDLATISHRLGVDPISLKELTLDELVKIKATGNNQRFLSRVSPESLSTSLKRSLNDMGVQDKEVLAAALKAPVADLASKPGEILIMAREKSTATQKDLASAKAFLKELASREKKAAEATKTALEDIVIDEKDTLKTVFDILGLDSYGLGLANVFIKELTPEERATIGLAEKVVALDRSFLKDMSGEEKIDLDAKKKSLDLTLTLLSLVRGPLEQVIDDGVVKIGEARSLAALNRRKIVFLKENVEATVVHFRQWKPGSPRWEGVYFIDKNQKCVPWKLDNRVSLASDPLPMRLGEVHAVTTTSDEDGAAPSVGGSRFARKVASLPRPLGQFVEVTLRFRNIGDKSTAIPFCTPASVYAGAYVQLADGSAMAPVDFVLAGMGLASETAETAKDLTLVSDLALSPAGNMGFELDNRQETCALFLFDVPRDAARFQLVIMGKTIDLGLPLSTSAFEPVDDKMIP